MYTFMIPSFNMDKLNDSLEKLNRRAKRIGCQEVTTKVLGTQRRKVAYPVGEDEAGWTKVDYYWVTYYEVSVEGLSPVYAGWEFLGTLEHSKEGNILRAVPGKEFPTEYREAKPKCDHCKKARTRKDTYIVANEGGEFKQVGHNCVRDFLGHADPKHLALLASMIEDITAISEEKFSSGNVRAVVTDDFLSYAAECVLRFGWTSGTSARNYAMKSDGKMIETTASKAWRYMHPTKDMLKRGDVINVSQEAIDMAYEARSWGKTANQTDKSDYIHNLTVACQKDVIERRHAGIVASVVSAYQRFIGATVARHAARKAMENSEWFGTPKKREIFTVTVRGQHNFDLGNGQMLALYRMQDQDGNVCIWKTTTGDLRVDETYKLKATVKEHSTYRDIKQTILQRCQVVEIIQITGQTVTEDVSSTSTGGSHGKVG